VQTQTFEVVNDPRVRTSMADLQEQFALLLRIRGKISAIHEAVNRLRNVREQVELWRKRAGDHPTIDAAATALLEKLASIEDALILPGDQKVTYSLIIRSRLNEALASVIPIVGSADARPTEQACAIVEHYSAQIDAQLAALEAVFSEDLAKLNRAIQEANLAPIEG
jgi:CHAD domain-containing protein